MMTGSNMKRGAYFNEDEQDQKQIRTPIMARSRNQLASSYAPGSFFTFEGGLGACISIPDQSAVPDIANINIQTQEQIVLRLQEAWQNWFTRAYSINSDERPIDPTQCIDGMLLHGSALLPLGASYLQFVNPLKMGYAPAPLSFVCNTCGMFKEYESVADAARNINVFSPINCPNPKKKSDCKWRQLDVVFVHWSGDYMPATPGMWEWSEQNQEAYLKGQTCASCGSKDFLLHTHSPRIGEWGFECANCGHRERATWLQNDKFTTEVFRDTARAPSERRMEPISYRASSAFYAQSEQFVVFSDCDQNLLTLLMPQNTKALASFICGKYGYGGTEPTPEEMKAILLQGGHSEKWQTYEYHKKNYDRAVRMKDEVFIKEVDEELRKLVIDWSSGEAPLLPITGELPELVYAQLARREDFTSRYDPFTLSVEHEALMRNKVRATSELGVRAPFVRFYQLDTDLAPKSEQTKIAQEARTLTLMNMLGLSELGLIREFELCRFTHGYTRVSASPFINKRNQDMPVRLRLFEPLKNGKRPIYVVKQANEAIYVTLKPELVYQWLKEIGVEDLPHWIPDGKVKFGGPILESAQPFGQYFSLLRPSGATTYRYMYTLLHSFAHLFMKSIAEFSGLDLGSLGEYVFPADLSFVVYRNGTTMDLGNLSSLWRNENNQFLAHLLEPSSHRCNSGSLCDAHGGACPDCIMVPETSCIAMNRLLSRAVLRGGEAPREDQTHAGGRIKGYLEVVNGTSDI